MQNFLVKLNLWFLQISWKLVKAYLIIGIFVALAVGFMILMYYIFDKDDFKEFMDDACRECYDIYSPMYKPNKNDYNLLIILVLLVSFVVWPAAIYTIFIDHDEDDE